MTPYSSGAGACVAGHVPRVEKPAMPRVPAAALPEEPVRFYAWQDQAACLARDRELFFAAESEAFGAKARREAAALQICRNACPVRRQCLQHALSMPERAGVWGISENDLQEELQRRSTGQKRGRPIEVLLAIGLAEAA